MRSTPQKKPISPLQKYANIYVKRKAELIPMMEAVTGEEFSKNATHGELASKYIELLKTNQAFADEVEDMVNEYGNAVDPVSAIAEAVGGIANIFGQAQERKTAEAQQDAILMQAILNSQKKDDNSTILIVTGVSLLAVGGLIFFLVKRKK